MREKRWPGGVRQRIRVQKQRFFCKGSLSRAYRFVLPVLKGMPLKPVESENYSMECMRKLYSPKTIASHATSLKTGAAGRKLRNKKCLAWWLPRLLENLGPAIRLENEPGPRELEVFQAWLREKSVACSGRQRSPMRNLWRQLEQLGIHPRYAEATTENCSDAERALLPRWRCAVENHSNFAAIQQDWKNRSSLRVFIGYLEELYAKSHSRDLCACGRLCSADAAAFVRAKKLAGRALFVHPARFELLCLTGLGDSEREQLQAPPQQDAPPAALAHLGELSAVNRASARSRYSQLELILGCPPCYACRAYTVEEIADRLLRFDAERVRDRSSAPAKYAAFTGPKILPLLEAEMKFQGLQLKWDSLRMMLPPRMLKETAFEHFCKRSPWHRALLTDVEASYTETARTAYPRGYREQLRREIAQCAVFLDRRSSELFHEDPTYNAPLEGGTFALDRFIRTSGAQAIRDAAVAFMREHVSNNDRVKTAAEGHSAEGRAGAIIRFFTAISGRLPEGALERLNKSKLLRSVKNEREAADPMVRRTFLKEEVEAMLEVCKDDKKLRLFLLLLSQVGLRIGAVANLKVNVLVDENNRPRQCCSVMEKGRARRACVLSSLVQEAVRDYFETELAPQLRLEAAPHPSRFHVFNALKPDAPPSTSTLRQWLQRIGALAGIVDVRVHPHAFRHTIVGNLMDAGNSMEVTSKFMGHKSTRTTHNHYWVADVQELQELMDNPMTGAAHDRHEALEALRLQVEVLQRKKEKAMQIINTYNVILGEAKQSKASAEDAVSRIKRELPQLARLLELIDDDEDSESEAECDEPRHTGGA